MSSTPGMSTSPLALSWDGVMCTYCRLLLDKVPLTDDGLAPDIVTLDFDHSVGWHTVATVKASAPFCPFCALIIVGIGDAWSDLQECHGQCTFTYAATHCTYKGSRPHVAVVLITRCSQKHFRRGEGCALAALDLSTHYPLRTTQHGLMMKPSQATVGGTEGFGGDEKLETQFDLSHARGYVERWIAICKHHDRCAGWTSEIGLIPGLPTRVIQISAANQQMKLKIVDGVRVNGGDRRYATLSHCWGLAHLPRLLRDNIRVLRDDLDFETLSLTFQEAVMFVREMGIRYLWIDALCIIQNDPEDWLMESAQMATVYANSWLNLSAHESQNGQGGLFRGVKPPKTISGRTRRDGQDQMISTNHVLARMNPGSDGMWVCYREFWHLLATETPLSQRAWVLQERYLAPRNLHFTRGGILWECAAMTASPSMPLAFDHCLGMKQIVAVEEPLTDVEIVYQTWHSLARRYVDMSLTRDSDRSIALSGLAQAFCYQLGLRPDDYLFGLWRPRLVSEICWRATNVSRRHTRKAEALGCLPSWSWLSAAHANHFSLMFTSVASSHRHCIQILHARINRTANLFGPLTVASLRIRGRMLPAVYGREHNANTEFLNKYEHSLCTASLDEAICFGGFSALAYLDHPEYYELETTRPSYSLIYLLPVQIANRGHMTSSDERTMHEPWGCEQREQMDCLMLVPSESNKTFRRIGLFRLSRQIRRCPLKDLMPEPFRHHISSSSSGVGDAGRKERNEGTRVTSSSFERAGLEENYDAQAHEIDVYHSNEAHPHCIEDQNVIYYQPRPGEEGSDGSPLHQAMFRWEPAEVPGWVYEQGVDNVLMERAFRADNVPRHLCEAVDENMIYTISLV